MSGNLSQNVKDVPTGYSSLNDVKKKIEKNWIIEVFHEKKIKNSQKEIIDYEYISEKVIDYKKKYQFKLENCELFFGKHVIVRVIKGNKAMNASPVKEEIWLFQGCYSDRNVINFPHKGKKEFPKKYNSYVKIVIEVRDGFKKSGSSYQWGNVDKSENLSLVVETEKFKFLNTETINKKKKKYIAYKKEQTKTGLPKDSFQIVSIKPNEVKINDPGVPARIYFNTQLNQNLILPDNNPNIQVNFGIKRADVRDINQTENNLKDIARFFISCIVPESETAKEVKVEVLCNISKNTLGFMDGFKYVDNNTSNNDKTPVDNENLFHIPFNPKDQQTIQGSFEDYNMDEVINGVSFYQGFLEKLFKTKSFLKVDFNFLKLKKSYLIEFMKSYKDKIDFLNRNILIHSSARGIHYVVYNLLKKLNCNPNRTDIYGNCSLHYSELYNHKELSELLINFGGNKSLKNKEGLCPEKFKEKYQKKFSIVVLDEKEKEYQKEKSYEYSEKEILHEKKKIKKQNNYIKRLSEEIILIVLSYLEVSQIFSSLGYVNKSFHNIIFGLESNYSHMWKSIVGQFGFEFSDKQNYKKISLELGVSYLKTLNEIKKIETYVNFSHKSPFRYKLISKYDVLIRSEEFEQEDDIVCFDDFDDCDDIYKSIIETDIFSFDYKKIFYLIGIQNFRISRLEFDYEALTHSIFLEKEKIFCIDVTVTGDEEQIIIELNIKKMIELQNNIKFKDFQRITQKKLDFDFLIRILQITSFFPQILENYYPKILEKYRRRDFIHKTNNFTEFNENVDERRDFSNISVYSSSEDERGVEYFQTYLSKTRPIEFDNISVYSSSSEDERGVENFQTDLSETRPIEFDNVPDYYSSEDERFGTIEEWPNSDESIE